MTDRKADDDKLDALPELPTDAELHEVPAMPEDAQPHEVPPALDTPPLPSMLEEIEEPVVATSAPVTPVQAAGDSKTEGSSADSGEKSARERRQSGPPAGGKRELDRAPLELRKASIVLMAGSIFPWGDPANVGLVGGYVEKIICYVAIYLFFQSHVLKYGGKANPLVAALGKSNVLIPMIAAGVIALVGLAPVATFGSGAGGLQIFTVVMEKAFLLLAGYTFVHIYDYEHGGKFNPMFPLMFLFPAIGGLMAILLKDVPAFGELGAKAGVSVVGALIVTGAGGIACHTMYVAMKEAKAHGEAKRQAAQEARKAARDARKRQQGGGA